MTCVIAEPCIDVKDRTCVDVCPVEAIYPADALPSKWERFVSISASYRAGDAAETDALVERFAPPSN
jgi:Fe-S-cluster-containing hydrogenase component 2